jgi:nucleoside-diphosphate-sugar epimerase
VPVLVLGASGFIGRWVARQLSATGANLTCAVRDVSSMRAVGNDYGVSADFVEVDLMNPSAVHELFAQRRPAVTFNLAGYGIDRSEQHEDCMWRINAELVGQLGELAERFAAAEWSGQRVVHAGSALEYGTIGGHLPEEAVPAPETRYGQSKLAGTRLLRAQAPDRTVTARLFTVYGPGEHPGRLLPSLMAATDGTTPVALSAGLQRRDFTYVEDVAEGLLRLGLKRSIPGGLVNLATGCLCSVREFAEATARVLQIPASRLHFGALEQRPDEMPHDLVSVERLRQSLHWAPGIPVAEGVSRTVAFLHALSAQHVTSRPRH